MFPRCRLPWVSSGAEYAPSSPSPASSHACRDRPASRRRARVGFMKSSTTVSRSSRTGAAATRGSTPATATTSRTASRPFLFRVHSLYTREGSDGPDHSRPTIVGCTCQQTKRPARNVSTALWPAAWKGLGKRKGDETRCTVLTTFEVPVKILERPRQTHPPARACPNY